MNMFRRFSQVAVFVGVLGLTTACTNPDGTLNGGATALAIGAAGLAVGAVALSAHGNNRYYYSTPRRHYGYNPSWGYRPPASRWGYRPYPQWGGHHHGWSGPYYGHGYRRW